ncbi:MAG: hypothetical protein DRQ01_09815 [Ignavibacteriae bacterium]|nr:MAG: hypothetical protein DRQ01_09815 [Ignavibacteriota bacterium]
MKHHRKIKSIVSVLIKGGITGIIAFGIVPYLFTMEKSNLVISLVEGLIIGILFGFAENMFFTNRLKKFSFSALLIIRTFVYSIIYFGGAMIMLLILLYYGGLSISDIGSQKFYDYITNIHPQLGLFPAVFISFIISYLWQINSMLGRGVLLKYVRGKYHKPVSEDRIFMFLDLSSATTIAEQLGAQKYSQFLKDFFYDIDEVITDTKGEIFQYEGDGIIILWTVKNGTNNNNCVELFFKAKEKLSGLKDNYFEKDGLSPEYKAGLHYGKVVIAEIGDSKKEIAYHGDAINTTARICSSCNEVNRKLLISSELLQKLKLNNNYDVESMGEFKLKGKENIIKLFSIDILTDKAT